MQTGDVKTGRQPGEEQPGLHMPNDPAALPWMGTPFSQRDMNSFCMHVSIVTLKRFIQKVWKWVRGIKRNILVSKWNEKGPCTDQR